MASGCNTPDLVADAADFFAAHPIEQAAKTLEQILERQRVNAALRQPRERCVRRIPRHVRLTTSSGSVTAWTHLSTMGPSRCRDPKGHPDEEVLAGAAALAAVLIAIPAGRSLSAQEPVSVMLLHGVPGVTVDVVVDGAVVIPGFEPGDMQDLSSFAGQTLENVEVRVAGTEDVAIGPVAEFPVPASGNWTVVAHLDADGTPTITPFENDTAAVDAGSGRLTVVHVAAAPAVDVVLGDARPVKNLSNGSAQSLVLPAGEIRSDRTDRRRPDRPRSDRVGRVERENLTVYTVGSLANETFTFYTQTIALEFGRISAAGDGTPAPTAVNTGGAVDSSSNSMALFAAAAGLFALAGGAMILRRRTVEA